jgi:CheY-like chemotaxis protein
LRNILVIEDVVEQRELVTEVLQRRGFTVTAVADGRQGIALLQERDFDGIVLDLRMPKCNGETVVQWILENRIHLRSRILIVSGDMLSPGLWTLIECLELPLLSKPYELRQLIEAVEEITGPPNEERRNRIRGI